MSGPATPAPGVTLRGLDACAWVLATTVSAYAVAGGEGARQLADAVEAIVRAHPEGAPVRLVGDGADAARAVLGHALGGGTVAVLASGDALGAIVPVLREAHRQAAPVVVVVAAHGDDLGRPQPEAPPTDLAALLDVPVGVVLAGDVAQAADLTLALVRAAADRCAPWVVGFELAGVGLHAAHVSLPLAGLPARHAPAVTGGVGALAHAETAGVARARSVARYGFALGAALREIDRGTGRTTGMLCTAGPGDPDVVLVAAGASVRGARGVMEAIEGRAGLRLGVVQVVSLRPFPAVEIVRHTWRARVVIVHELFPDGVGMGGSLGDGLKAAFADALTWHPDHAGIGRVPTVTTVHCRGVLGIAGWSEAVRAVDARDPPRWIEVPPEVEGPGAT